MRRFQASLVLLLVWESSCQKKQVAVPVPSAPKATSRPVSPGPAPAASTAAAPSSGTTTHAEEPSPYQVNKPAPAAPAAKKPARSATGPATPPPISSPAPSPTPATASAPPKLGEVLSPDEEKQYRSAIDQSLSQAQTSLNSIGGRQLNKDQLAEVEHIRNFMQQAQTARGSDPAGAKSLAERAEVLARDLAAAVK